MSINKRIYTAALLSAAVSIQTMIAPNALSHQPGCITGQIDHRGWFNATMATIDDQVELMVATTPVHLRRALRFATNVLGVPVYMVMATPENLGRALCEHYPLPGMTPRSVVDDGMDRLLNMVLD